VPTPSDKRVQSSQKLASLLRKNEPEVMSTVDFRRNSAAVVSRVAIGGERIVLTRNRKPVAAIVSYEDFKLIERSARRRQGHQSRE
jgi:prevent-host-death family protein